MDIKFDYILSFHNDYKPANKPPKKEGFYMTIRCGLNGIYYYLNEWKDGDWLVNILDNSFVIAYSKETIEREVVDEWVKNETKKGI